MAFPVELVGAWRRVVDYCDVLWLPSADWFADVRTDTDG
ncbi:MAG: hypothetical protein JWR11_4718 [Mycobacterium sp.]|jgi:hypothetical protein|nr:hypothetical protein [Mycobacterium sp.]MDT5178392.1 hypothetical protein [Mycobacterium sp.]